MITDKDRIDCIQWLLDNEDCFQLKSKYNPFVEHPDYGKIGIELFTVITQHIEGKSVRKLIDKVIKKRGFINIK